MSDIKIKNPSQNPGPSFGLRTAFLAFFFFVSHSSFSESAILTAQDESLFDDSDLADIDSPLADDEEDKLLEEEFESLEGEESEDNFDEEDFEVIDEEEETEEKEEESEEESDEDLEGEEEFFEEDYEIVSDRPDYEELSDKELEREFEGEEPQSSAPAGDLEDQDDEKEKEKEEGLGLESLEETEESEDMEGAEEGQLSEEEEAMDEEQALDEEQGFSEEGLENEGDMAEEELEALSGEDPLDEAAAEESLNLIANIRYVAQKDQIIIDCSETISHQERRNEETRQFIIEILQAKLSENLHWPYVLRDFSGSFALIKADQKDSSTARIIIQLKEGMDFPRVVSSKDGNQMIIGYGQAVGGEIILEDQARAENPSSILPAKTLEDLYYGDLTFSGEKMSFHVDKAPVKQVLRFISEESGLNMVIGEGVSGTITLKLEDVPWDQALHTIFKVKSLGYTRDGNVITILPLSEIEARAKKLKDISDRQKNLAPFITKAIPVNYGKISEIETKVKDFSTPASDFNKGGRIIVHEESGAFIVIDTAEAIKKIEALVKYLDKPPKQVMVEAKIVEVSETFSRNLGLNWGISGNVPVSVNVSGVADLFRSISGSYNVNSEGNASFGLNGLPIIGDISASLNLAESEGHAQLISAPKVVVISGKSASITRNAPILISKGSVVGQAQTQQAGGDGAQVPAQTPPVTEDIQIGMDVTPTVTTGGSVFLTVSVNRTDPGSAVEGETLSISRSAETEILAKNGQTIVIGGIYEQDRAKGSDGIPFLRDIPFLNMLFNQSNNRESKTELLVFITPRVIDSHEEDSESGPSLDLS